MRFINAERWIANLMEVTITENDNSFHFNFKAVDMKEAAQLTRLGMNHVRELGYVGSDVFADAGFYFTLNLKKHARNSSSVPTRSKRK